MNTFYTKEEFLMCMVDIGSYVMYLLQKGVTLVFTDMLVSKCVIKCRQERWTCLVLSGAFTVYLK